MATDTISTKDFFAPTKKGDIVSSKDFFSGELEGEIITSTVIPEEDLREMREQEFLQQGLKSGEIVQEQPGLIDRIRGELPQIGGGIAGGLAFSRAAKPAIQNIQDPRLRMLARGGAFLGGTFFGAMAGKSVQQQFRLAQPGAQSMTLRELYTEQLVAGIEEAGSELAGRGIAKGLGKVIKPIAGAIGRKIVAPGAKEAAKLLQKSGLGVTLAQATDNRIIDLMESIAEGSLFSGGKLQKLKTILIPKAIKKAVGELSDDFASSLGKLTPEQTGEVVLDAINQKNTAFKRASRSIYKQVDKLITRSGKTGEIVNITALKKFARQRLSSKVNILKSTTGDTLLESVLNLPDRVTFKQASSLRSALLTQVRTMSTTKDVALGVTKQLAKLADGAIEKGGRQLSGDALDMWRFANKFHREGKQVFNSKLFKTLGRTLADNPEKAIPRIFQKGASKQIKLLKNTVDESTWNALKHSYLESILTKGQSPTGEFIGTRFLNQLDDDVLRATFKPEEITSIKAIGNAAELLQRPAAGFGATGRLVVAISQAGLLTGSAFIQSPKTAAAIILTPAAFSWIATNPKWSRLLIEGMKDPIKFSGSLARLGRIASGLDVENIMRKRQADERNRIKQLDIEEEADIKRFGLERFPISP